MIRFVTVLVLSLFALGAWAQDSPPHRDQIPQSNVASTPMHFHGDPSAFPKIDGAKNPELIPDSTAYRLWLLAVSTPPNPSAEEIARQDSHLNMVNLSKPDKVALVGILIDFRLRYIALTALHNQQATAAQSRGEAIDNTLFLRQRDDLVTSVRNSISLLLGPGSGAIKAYVQSEKTKMVIPVKEGQ